MTSPPYLDTHCHLDAYFRPSEPAEAAALVDVEVIAVTNLPSHFNALRSRVKQHNNVRVALGVHPQVVDKMHEAEWRIFRAMASTADDIGEVGLDFSPGADRSVQERAFARVLSMVGDRPRLLTIHSRRAIRPVLKHLADANLRGTILHWFSGSSSDLDATLTAGQLVSVNTSMISSTRGMSIVRALPRERVLTESDGPYARFRGNPACPSDVRAVYHALAKLWGADVTAVRIQLAKNLASIRSGVGTGPLTLFS